MGREKSRKGKEIVEKHELTDEMMARLELQRTRVVCGPDVNLYVRNYAEFLPVARNLDCVSVISFYYLMNYVSAM